MRHPRSRSRLDEKLEALAQVRKAPGDRKAAIPHLEEVLKIALVPEKDAEAAAWYRRAADQGHALAQFNLANMYASGQGVTLDDAEAATARSISTA